MILNENMKANDFLVVVIVIGYLRTGDGDQVILFELDRR